jgi:plastocyanin
VQRGSLPEIVVFLESTDPQATFRTPEERLAISQNGAKFSPPVLVVCRGQTVDFLNDEDRPIEHNVFSQSTPKAFDLGLYRPGVTKSVTFDEPGVVRLYCSIHRHMDGAILVCPTPFFAQVSPDGQFRIKGIPEGRYVLKTWQRRRRFVEQSIPVTVSGASPVRLSIELSRK